MGAKASKFKLERIDQVAIIAKDADKVGKAWASVAGVEPWEFRDLDATNDKLYPRRVRLGFANIGPNQIEIIQPNYGSTPPSNWHKVHGDGIHHIGTIVDDLDKGVDALVSSGVRCLIKYPGRFALLDHPDLGGVVIELMAGHPPSSENKANFKLGKYKIEKLDQVAIIAKNADKVANAWETLLGVGPWEFRDLDASDDPLYPRRVRLAFAMVGPNQIEIIQPNWGSTPPANWHKVHGDGIHHIGFKVDDLDKSVDSLVAQGARTLIKYPGRFALMDNPDMGGVVIEPILIR